MEKVVVLGAGYAGIKAALTLHKKMKHRDVSIEIIDKHDHHILLTELHEVAGSRVTEESVQVSLKNIFQYTSVQLTQDEITSIDFHRQQLLSHHHSYDYDYLIIGCGSEPAFFDIDGMQDHAYTLWSLEDAKIIHHQIRSMFKKASKESDESIRKKYLTFVVGGGGFTGIEMIGELLQWTKILAKEYSIDYHEVQLIVIEATEGILSLLNNDLANKATKYMEKHGIQIMTNSPITKVTPDGVQIKNDTLLHTHTVIWTGGIKVNHFIESLGLPAGQKGRGRITVNEYTQSTKFENIFLIGDNSYFIDEDGKVLPPLVESALQTGETAAKNILHLIDGHPLEKCTPKLHGIMVSIGRKYAVADVMGFKSSGLLAMFIKHLVNIHYQFEIGGFEQVIHYLKHQFVHVRGDDHFLKKHLIPRSFVLFLVPMRLYLGYQWLIQGLTKYREGWLRNILIYAERIGPTLPDAVSNPSPAADTAQEAVKQGLNLIGEHTPIWYAWILENVIVPHALIFQRLIVFTEIGLGLAFLTGTLTFIAALVSIGMNINFVFSTGLYDYWYLVTSIACMGGAGLSFGVDHYLLPWLMGQWRYFARNFKIKLKL